MRYSTRACKRRRNDEEKSKKQNDKQQIRRSGPYKNEELEFIINSLSSTFLFFSLKFLEPFQESLKSYILRLSYVQRFRWRQDTKENGFMPMETGHQGKWIYVARSVRGRMHRSRARVLGLQDHACCYSNERQGSDERFYAGSKRA